MNRFVLQYSIKKVVSPESELSWAAAGWAVWVDKGGDSAEDIIIPSRMSVVPPAQITLSVKSQPYLRKTTGL